MSRPRPSAPLFPYTTLFRSLTFDYFRQELDLCPKVRSAGWPRWLKRMRPRPRRRSPTSAGNTTTRFLRNGKKRSEEHTSELQSHSDLVCRLLLEKKKKRSDRRRRNIDGQHQR